MTRPRSVRGVPRALIAPRRAPPPPREPAPFNLAEPAAAAAVRAMEDLQRSILPSADAAAAVVLGGIADEGPGWLKGTDGEILHDPETEQRFDRVRSALAATRTVGIGAGSNRMACELDPSRQRPDPPDFVAKLTWNHVGITHNLFDAAVWLTVEDSRAARICPSLAITARAVLIQRYVTTVVVPTPPERRRQEAARKAAFERYVALTRDPSGGPHGVPPSYQVSPFEPEIHKLRRRIGQPPRDDPRCDNYGFWQGRLVAIEPKPAGLAGALKAASEWLKQRITDEGALVLDRQTLRPLLGEHLAALGERLPSDTRTSSARVGRNDPCPCGSGRKFKRCCS
jgi:hypothetical protein